MGDLAIPAKPPKLKLIPVFWISMYRAHNAVKSAATVFLNLRESLCLICR
jgi:hypothetical protein